jgi:hypothetical protein
MEYRKGGFRVILSLNGIKGIQIAIPAEFGPLLLFKSDVSIRVAHFDALPKISLSQEAG